MWRVILKKSESALFWLSLYRKSRHFYCAVVHSMCSWQRHLCSCKIQNTQLVICVNHTAGETIWHNKMQEILIMTFVTREIRADCIVFMEKDIYQACKFTLLSSHLNAFVKLHCKHPWPWPWFIPYPTGHIGPHSDAIHICQELPPLLPEPSSQVNPIFCRSLLTVLLQFALGRPGPLLYPGTCQYSACCGMRWWSIRKTCPSQRSRLSLSML